MWQLKMQLKLLSTSGMKIYWWKGMRSSQVSICNTWAARSLTPELPGRQEHKTFLFFLQK